MNTDSLLSVFGEMGVKSALVLLVAATVVWLWRNASAAQRHLVWMAAFATILLLPVGRLAKPWWSIPLHQPQPANRVHLTLPMIPGPNVVPAVTIETAPSQPPPKPRHTLAPATLLLAIWLGGAALTLGYRLVGIWRLWRLERRSHTPDDERLLGCARQAFHELKIRRSVRLVISAECLVPMTWRTFRPVLMLPLAARQWTDERLIAALRHEAGHISRGDHLVRWLSHLTCAIYWPNPLIWLAARALRITQEQATDDLVLRVGTPAEDYAAQLFEAAQLVGRSGLFTTEAVAMASPSTLETRVVAVLDPQRNRASLGRPALIGGAVVAAIALVLCNSAQIAVAADGKANAETAPQDNSAVEIDAKFVSIAARDDEEKAEFASKPEILTKPQFELLIRSLNQKKGTDILSSPRILTPWNRRAVIEITREFRYPTQWEGDGPGGWKSKASSTKDVGVKLDITAKRNPSGAIDLHLKPHLTEFTGFTDLDAPATSARRRGNDATSPDPTISGAPMSTEHRRLRPNFSEREAEKDVTLHPGETALINVFGTPAHREGDKHDTRNKLLLFVTASIKPSRTTGQASQAAPAHEPLPPDGVVNFTVPAADEFPFAAKAAAQRVAQPSKVGAENFITKEWKLPPDMIPPKPGGDGAERQSAREWLTANGVQFEGSATATYIAASSRLIVRNTAGQIDRVDQLVAQKIAASPAVEERPAAPLWLAYGAIRLDKIVIPKFELREATLTEALDALRMKAKELDPEKTGVNIVVKPGVTSDARITLSLSNIPLVEALHYIVSLANLEWEAQPNAIVVQRPKGKAAAGGPPVTEFDGLIVYNSPVTSVGEKPAPKTDELPKVMVSAGTLTLAGKDNAKTETGHSDLEQNATSPLKLTGGTLELSKGKENPEPVEITSNSSRMENGIAVGEGNANLKWGKQTMKADQIHYNPTTRQVDLTGKVEIKNDTSLLQAEHVTLWLTPGGQMKVEEPNRVNLPDPAPQAAPTPPPADENPLLAKADKIILPKLEFREATLAEAIDFLGKRDVKIVAEPGVARDVRITVSLTNIPLSEALRYVAGLADLDLVAQPTALVLRAHGSSFTAP